MKQLKDPKKILFYAIIALIIVAGIIMVLVKGFNVELRYTANKKVELAIGETVDLPKIQEKSDEVFGKGKSIVQIVEVYKDTVQVVAKDISEEQKNSLVEKINELYKQDEEEANNNEGEEANVDETQGETSNTDATQGEETNTDTTQEEEDNTNQPLDASEIEIQSTENAHIRDFLKPYILPMALATVIILVYFAILYRKLGVQNVLIKAILIIVLSQMVLLSLLALLRIPMGRVTTPLILLVYVTSLIYISGSLDADSKAKK